MLVATKASFHLLLRKLLFAVHLLHKIDIDRRRIALNIKEGQKASRLRSSNSNSSRDPRSKIQHSTFNIRRISFGDTFAWLWACCSGQWSPSAKSHRYWTRYIHSYIYTFIYPYNSHGKLFAFLCNYLFMRRLANQSPS